MTPEEILMFIIIVDIFLAICLYFMRKINGK